MLQALGHHYHPDDGDGEEVLDTGLGLVGHHERNRSMNDLHLYLCDKLCWISAKLE